MKKTFREFVMFKYMAIAKKCKILKPFAFVIMTVLLGGYYLVRYFSVNARRMCAALLSVAFFFSTASFSFAIFGSDNSFINSAYDPSIVVEDFDVSLAEVKVPLAQPELSGEEELSYEEYENPELLTEEDTVSIDEIIEAGYELDELEEEIPVVDSLGENIEFDSSDWRLILVNKQHPIPDDYEFKLGVIAGSMQCDERILNDLLLMLNAAKKDGINLAVCSPYRDQARQEMLFARKINNYMGRGLSYMEAYKTASLAVTVPGASEHQIGLAIDIFADNYMTLDEGFADTAAGIWLEENCSNYGFVIRYPAGKEYITSIEYEPWHFRYVGHEAAHVMTEEGLCLEEFWDKYL